MIRGAARVGDVCPLGLNFADFDDLVSQRRGKFDGVLDGGRRSTRVMRLDYLSARD